MNEPPESELQQLPPLFGLSADDSALNLMYLFQSDPERIRVTPPGGDPRTVNLRIMISNPRVDPVVLEKIAIAFPLEQRYIEPFWSAPTRLLLSVSRLPLWSTSVCQ